MLGNFQVNLSFQVSLLFKWRGPYRGLQWQQSKGNGPWYVVAWAKHGSCSPLPILPLLLPPPPLPHNVQKCPKMIADVYKFSEDFLFGCLGLFGVYAKFEVEGSNSFWEHVWKHDESWTDGWMDRWINWQTVAYYGLSCTLSSMHTAPRWNQIAPLASHSWIILQSQQCVLQLDAFYDTFLVPVIETCHRNVAV